MTDDVPSTTETPATTTISIDAMGGDKGPAAVVSGLAKLAPQHPDIRFLLHGPEAELAELLARQPALAQVTSIRHAEGRVAMEDKPSQVMRNGKGTSMWSTIEAVKQGDAACAVSCGNTGALMALSMLILRKMEGVKRPAIACYWPSQNPQAYNIMLDVGADVRADPPDLLAYALMGSSYARNALGLARPRIGLLNVGTEDNKGRPEMKEAADLIAARQEDGKFDYVGFVEGGDILTTKVDVVVTDGFTGNIALKTAEGTATMVRNLLRDSFRATLLSKFAALLAQAPLRRLAAKIDPRRSNGGVFLGLNGLVVKSHGSSDAVSIEAAVSLAIRLARSGFTERLAARVATGTVAGQDGQTAGAADGVS